MLHKVPSQPSQGPWSNAAKPSFRTLEEEGRLSNYPMVTQDTGCPGLVILSCGCVLWHALVVSAHSSTAGCRLQVAGASGRIEERGGYMPPV